MAKYSATDSRRAYDHRVDPIVAALLDARNRCHLSTRETFERFVSVSDAALCLVRGQDWRRIVDGIEPALPAFQAALGEIIYLVGQGYNDLIGPCYTALKQLDATLGQIFTPWSVARLMAVGIVSDAVMRAEGEPLRVLDPACGSGTLLLAVADALPPWMIERGQVMFAGVDLDPLCVNMTRLNLRLHGLMTCTRLVKVPRELTAEELTALRGYAAV